LLLIGKIAYIWSTKLVNQCGKPVWKTSFEYKKTTIYNSKKQKL